MNRTLVVGVLISLLLLLAAVLLQILEPSVLDLPSQWLAVAALPILIALFIGGYITKFKGFGVELEAALKARVTTINLTAGEALTDMPAEHKSSIGYLRGLSSPRTQATRRLRFGDGRDYDAGAIQEYLRTLPNLEVFEILSANDRIECLLPIDVFRKHPTIEGTHLDESRIQRFVDALRERSVSSAFSEYVLKLKLRSDLSLVDALRKMRAESAELASVVSSDDRYLGILRLRDVERHVADSVLRTRAA